MKLLAFAISVVIGSLAYSSAQAEDDEPSKTLIGFILGPDTRPLAGSQRVEFARAIESYCRYGRNFIPTPTPAEANWLQTEMNSKSSERVVKALQSRILESTVLIRYYEGCALTANKLSDSENSETPPNVSEWALLVSGMTSDDGLSEYPDMQRSKKAQEFGRSSKDIERYIKTAILDRIVVPLAQ